MRRFFKGLAALVCMASLPITAEANFVQLNWAGSGAANSNGFCVDDVGGFESQFAFTFDQLLQNGISNLFVSDGTKTSSGIIGVFDRSDFVATGLSVSTNLLPNVDQVVLKSANPLQPISLSENQTAFDWSQVVYVKNDKDYVIVEIHGQNTSNQTVPAFIGFGIDFNAGGSSANEGIGFDASRGLVYQQDSAQNYSAGVASLVHPVDQYRLGAIYAVTFGLGISGFVDPYILQNAFFKNTRQAEVCDDGLANNPNDMCNSHCLPRPAGTSCGNGVLEGGEECDDGNLIDGDGCDRRCNSEGVACGNGNLDQGEECDDGNRVSGDYCSLDCQAEFGDSDCGDGFINNGATGNQIPANQSFPLDLESDLSVKFENVEPGKGVTAAFCFIGAKGANLGASLASLQTKADDCLQFYTSTVSVCGNGIQNANEACDQGTLNSDSTPNACRTNCQWGACGDGVLDLGEACDDGNQTNGDCCNTNCQFENQGTSCDDGSSQTLNDQCNGAGLCTGTLASKTPVCGNGIVETAEQCDDGNKTDGDCCNAACQKETSEQCIDTNVSDHGGGCTLQDSSGSNNARQRGAMTAAIVGTFSGCLGLFMFLRRRKKLGK